MKTVHYVRIAGTHYVREDDGLVICKMLSHPRQEQNAKDIAHALNQHEKLVALLRQQEWGYHQTCPYCGGDKIETGHMDNCPLATLLKEEVTE